VKKTSRGAEKKETSQGTIEARAGLWDEKKGKSLLAGADTQLYKLGWKKKKKIRKVSRRKQAWPQRGTKE